ncbi:YegP family protein, partial [Zoogloea sp.]|uniref:YegP family protein n=1 Tax=Zoogloea sp. TaxID=49181 RepID=UPI0026162F79
MNAIPPSISRTPEDMALDAHALFQEGLVHLRRLAGKTWTDHNVHDPGITVLELATWALAEFGYRVSLPLEDLLSPPDGDHPALDRQFHRARQVLPVRPFTTLDWRKRLIDLPGVKNAWVEPVAPAPLYADLVRRQLSRTPPAHPHYREVILQGLYRVRVDFMDTLVTLAEQAPVQEAVRHCLETQRNLGEDFVAVEPVPTQRFALCAEVDLQADADVTETAARLLFAAARGIAPAVPSHALATLQRRPWPDGRARSVQEIFDGPLLEHGFIDETELIASELPTELHLSDLINILMDVPGVRAIPDILLTPVDPDGTPGKVTTPWRIPVASGHLPRLALEGGGTPAAGRLTFRKRGMPVAGWELAQIPAPVRERLRTLQEEARQSVESPFAEDLPLPTGRHRAVDAYRSFQLDFPALYGLGPAGLAGPTDPQRQVQVLQFKAWLTFFDQQIANDLALLGQVRHRLSVAPEDLNRIAGLFSGPTEQSRVLATQMVTSIPGYERLYAAGTTPETLAAQQESAAEAVTRQQRLLNHLLARIGEDFSEYAGVMASAFGHPDHQVIADTCHFLADAPTTTAHRAGAYDQSSRRPDALWNSLNVSGLEIRLARLLGIADFSRRNLGAVSYDTYAEVDATPGDEFRFRILRATDHKILLSSTGNFTSREAARARMIEAIERGQQTQPGHYRILEGRDGRFYFRVLAADGRVLARRVEGFATRQAAEDAVAGLSTYLREHYSG